MHRELGNQFIVDAYDFDMVKLALLTRGWYKKCCMPEVLDCMLWAMLSVLLGSNVAVKNSCMVTCV